MFNRPRIIEKVLAGSAAALFVLVASCTSSKSGDTPDASASSEYGTSACGTCVAQACGSQQSSCTQDPQCATYLSCLQECPVDATGNAEASCASACPLPNDAPGQAAQSAFATCRTQGAGASCCGGAPDAASDSPAGDASDGGANACSGQGATACEKCTAADCCPQETACAQSTDCVDLGICFNACASNPGDAGQPACQSACLAQYPKALAGFGAYISCPWINCGAPTACDDACNACAGAHCAGQMTACFQNADCVGYFYCPSGDTACYTKYTAGANLYNTFISCFTNSCSTECGG